MDRRAAGALLALAACFACSAAAPTASNQTALDLYEGAQEGCYYNFQHYGEGDRIMTNEPCLNCTCHNRMLMCYLRVCPFTKAIGQDCTVEKRADQCCPIVTCPDVPVDLLTSTSTTSPAEYGATGLGKLDKYGCSISGKYFPEGSKVPPTPNKPCEHCYCIRNMTTCVMQECTLHVDGCTPIYHKDVCCPVRYSCDHPEDEVPLLDDMSTTVRPTPGFLLTTTTISPVTQMTQDCIHDDRVFSDGALIKTEKACEHCYCMKGDIVCVVQECGAPMENEGKNCTSLPPREGQCCPDTYICEGDELTSDLPIESTTESIIEKLTTLSPPRRTSVEGSGYRNEPDEAPYTDMPEVEGSGEEEETSKPFGPDEIIPTPGDDDQYIYVTTKRPAYEEGEKTTLAIDKNIIPDIKDKTIEPHVYLSTTPAPVSEEVEKLTTSGIIEEAILEPHKHAPTTKAPESVTTELGDLQNTVPDVIPDEEIAKPHEYAPSTTNAPTSESESLSPIEGEDDKLTTSEKDVIMSATSKPEFSTTISSASDEIEKETDTPTHISNATPEVITEKEYTDGDITRTTIATSAEEDKTTSKPELLSPSSTISTDKESTKPEELAPSTTSSSFEEEKEIYKPDQLTPSTTSSPPEEEEKITTELDHAQNTVAVAEEDSTHPHSHISTTWASSKAEEESTTALNLGQDVVTDEVTKEGVVAPDEHFTTAAPSVKETEFTTAEPDRGLNTIPSEIYEETSSESPLPGRTTISEETKETEQSIITDEMQTQGIEIKSTTDSDLTTPLPDSSVTKGDQFTITTEPSFRKEDEGIVSTEKPKEIGSTTVKSEFVDEGLIPTSSHDDKIGSSSDAPTAEEDFTTSVPEYITEVAETIESKQTTTESPKETSTVTEILPEKVSKPSSEPDGDLPDTTDKQTEVTPVVEIHEEPSRIPGEGDCLLNGVTYRNNTVVPSTNNCHTGCRCASSIIKCDPIICSPPPDYMDNCQSIYDSPDSCCPTFVCDHPRETVPPQSDNQMSGTESPMPSPTIECRGDQCEISVPTKQPTGPSELCTSGSCLTVSDHKTETECGSEGCGDVSQKPDTSLPSVQHTEDCTDGKCKPESCGYGECQSTQTQVSPVTPCEGEHCEKSDEFVPGLPQQCNNEEDCKTIKIPTVDAVPCEGELCNKIDCADGSCDSDVSAPLPDHQMEPCKDEDGCKPQDIPVPECTGDEPCRRKEVSASDTKIPTTCEGPNCISEKETTSAQGVIDLSTESPKLEETPSEEATEKIEVEKTTELPDSYISKPADDKIPAKDTQEPDMYTTEGQTDKTFTSVDSQKEKPVVEDETTKTTTAIEEKGTEVPATMTEGDEKTPGAKEEITQKPIIIEKEETEAPDVIDAETTKPTTLVTEGEEPTIDEEKGTEKPIVVKDKDTKEPTLIDDEGKEKPAVIEKEGTEPPLIDGEKDTEKPVMIDEDTKDTPDLGSTKKPDIIDEEEGMTEPVITAEETTTIPDTEKKETDAPAIIDEISTNIPADTDEISKDKPVDTDKDTEKPIIVDEEGKPTDIDVKDKDKPEQEPIEEISSEKPALIEKEGTDKNAVEEATENPDVIKETTVKTIVPDKDEKEKPDDGKDETTEKLTIIEEKSTETPASVSDDDNKPATVEEDGKEKPAIIDETGTEKPIAEDADKKPVIFEHDDKEKPTPVDKESTEKPLLEQDVKTEPAIVDQESTERIMTPDDLKPETSTEIEGEPKEKPAVVAETTKPDLIDEEKSSESPLVTIVDGSETTPAIVDKDTDKPVLVDKDGIKKPAVIEIESTKPTDIEVERTELPVDVGEENTQMPVIIDEQSTIIPITEGDTLSILKEESTVAPGVTEEKGTAKPFIIDEGTEEPNIIEKEDATKPALFEREGTELPAVIGEEGTDKPLLIDEETKEKPDFTDQEDTKITAMVEKETDKPGVIEEGTEEPSTFETEATVKPALIDEAGKPVDEDDAKKPIQVGEEKHQEKPVVDKKEDKPIIIDEEITDKPIVDEVVSTEEPKKHEEEEEGSGTEIPEALHTIEPEKEVSPEITEATITEIERTTKIPYSESQTTIVHETPEIMVTDTVTKEPFIHDYSRIPEITTESLIEQEKITISEQVEVTTFKVHTSDVKEEGSTVGQDLISEEPALTTKAPVLHETSESTEKTTEMGLISEPEEISTDTSEIESPTTRAPGTGPVIIEPQEGIDDKPELHVTSKTEEESTTKVYEEDKIKPSSESHVTEASSTSPEYETSDGITDVSEITDEHKPKPQSPELVGTELDKTTTQVSPLEIKTGHPEIYGTDKQEPVTETQGYSVTEPVRRVTEIEDTSVTGQEDIATGYPEVTKDHHIPLATDKIDESGDVGITSSEKPLLTDMETQDLPEKSSESDKPVTKVPEDYQTPEAEKEKPIDEIVSPATEIPISMVTESHETSDVPEKDVSSYDDKSTIIPDLSDHKHKDTTPPIGYTDQQELDTEIPQHHVTSTEEEMKVSETYVTEPYITESQETSTKSVEQEVKDSQTITTDIPSISDKEGETETRAPELMHTGSHALEPSITEMQKLSTELPISSEDVLTELPGVQISSEVPQSLVTEQKESLGEQTTVSIIPKGESSYKPDLLTTQFEEISKGPEQHVTEKEIQTEAPIHVTEQVEVSTVKPEQGDQITHVFEEAVTDKQDTATTLRESPAVTEKIEQIEVMKSTEHTSAQTEFSETTPYLIELQEHTHKIVEDITTVSPSEEEHTDKLVEDTSTPSPSEDEHSYKPVEDITTPSPSEEEHSYKPVKDISTSSPSEEEHSYKPVEDISTPSPSEEEHSYKPVEDISTPSPSEEEHSYKPVEDISTSSPSEEEHSYKPVEDISTSSPSKEEHSYKPVEDISTSSPSEEEHSFKPVEDISTLLPSEEEHSYKPVEDISTSSPSEEEHSYKPVEDISTSSPSEEEHSYKPVEDISTSSPSEEEHSYKPVEDISTSSPPEEEHSYKPVEDISTSSPSEEEQSYKPVEDISTSLPADEEHSHKPVEDISTSSPSEDEHSYKPVEEISTSSPSEEEHSYKPVQDISTSSPPAEEYTPQTEEHVSELTTKKTGEEIETATKETEATISESVPVEETTPVVIQGEDSKYTADHKEYTTAAPTQISEESTPAVSTETEKLPISESDIAVSTEKEISTSERPSHPIVSHETTPPEEEFIFSTTKATTISQEEDIVTPVLDDKFGKPEEKPTETSEVPPSSTTTEVSKPGLSDLQPTDEIPVPDEDGHFPPSGTSGYGEPDYVEEDQAFGPGTCRYGGKVYVSAQQIPRDDPCDFCFCFRSDIICLQQSCPPPIHGCHEEPIQGFCCPRYECPVSMATTVNVTTTTTTTTTTVPPNFPTHSYKGAAQRRGCQIKGHTYKVGEVVRSSSGPCLHCTCGGDGQMKCDPKACTPEPMLRQMIAAAVSAKRRR